MRAHYANLAAVVIGRGLFDLTNGWNGRPAAGEHVLVVTHQPPKHWEHTGTAPFTFVDGVEAAISAARDCAGDRIVDGAAEPASIAISPRQPEPAHHLPGGRSREILLAEAVSDHGFG